MIIEKYGHIIITELRPMSEANDDETVLVACIENSGMRHGYRISKADGLWRVFGYPVLVNESDLLGWTPLPIYKPEQQHIAQTCEKCGASNVKTAVQMCSVDPDSDEVCPGSVLWG